MDVSVIIVNYNMADIINQCIDSVLQQKNCDVEIIVVDNASKDKSVDKLKLYGDNIKLVSNSANLGFGVANNIGFKHATGQYVFLLNPDAVLSTNDALEKMIRFIETNKQYGIVGPKINAIEGTHPEKYYPGQKYLQKPLETLPGEIAWVIGASMLIPREVYEKVGGFDEDYFLYGEETDLCLRVRRAGWAIGYNENVIVQHIGRVSERSSTLREYTQLKQSGKLLFYRKNYGPKETLRLIDRETRLAKQRLFFLKFFKNPKKQEKAQAILDVSQKERLLCASLLA